MGNFNQHKDQLLLKRKTWVDPFAPNLEEKIDHGLDILGINTKIEQTTTTRQLVTRQKHAMNQLATFKVQLEVDFEDDPDTLKQLEDKLGFSRHYNQVRSGDQEALIQLLAALKQNVSPEVKTQIKDAGTDIAIIDELITMRDEINEINIKGV